MDQQFKLQEIEIKPPIISRDNGKSLKTDVNEKLLSYFTAVKFVYLFEGVPYSFFFAPKQIDVSSSIYLRLKLNTNLAPGNFKFPPTEVWESLSSFPKHQLPILIIDLNFFSYLPTILTILF